jgi:hypothetical protein
MFIKIKSYEVSVGSYKSSFPIQCGWCGKTIKAGKYYYLGSDISGIGVTDACSLSHFKQKYKALRGL